MRVFALSGVEWRSVEDVIDALLAVLEAPAWHGRSYDALLDSIGTGGINAIEPPYRIDVTGARMMGPEALRLICDLRADIERRTGEDAEAGLPHRAVELVLDGDF